MQQIWKKHPIYQDYCGSNLGRVKSINYNHTEKEKLLRKTKIIKHNKNRDYIAQQVCVYKNKKRIHYSVHRFIYQCFNGIIPQDLQIDHIDNNPSNNKLQNLQLLTSSENTKKIHIDNPNYVCNNQFGNKRIICLNNHQIYNSQHEAGRKLNLDYRLINMVLKGRTKHTHGYRFRYYIEQDKINNLQQLKFDFI